MIEVGDRVLRLSRQVGQQIALKLMDKLTDPTFEINAMKRYIKRLVDCRQLYSRKRNEIMKDCELHRALVRGSGTKKDGH